MSLILKCLSLAEEYANEINGDLDSVPQEDIDKVLLNLTEDNVEEIASELAELAHWFNWNLMKKFIYQHCNSNQIKVIIARSEYKALTQNFGNLAGYKFSHSLPLN